MEYKNIKVLEKQQYGPLRFGVCQYGYRLKNNYHMVNSSWYHYLSDNITCKCKRKNS